MFDEDAIDPHELILHLDNVDPHIWEVDEFGAITIRDTITGSGIYYPPMVMGACASPYGVARTCWTEDLDNRDHQRQ